MQGKQVLRALVIMSILGSAGCGSGPSNSTKAAASTQADRKYLLERVDDAAVVQMYADGFAELSLREKTLVWHLYQAATSFTTSDTDTTSRCGTSSRPSSRTNPA
jgi:hypothetical protein